MDKELQGKIYRETEEQDLMRDRNGKENNRAQRKRIVEEERKRSRMREVRENKDKEI